jgi:hypothetical protein
MAVIVDRRFNEMRGGGAARFCHLRGRGNILARSRSLPWLSYRGSIEVLETLADRLDFGTMLASARIGTWMP